MQRRPTVGVLCMYVGIVRDQKLYYAQTTVQSSFMQGSLEWNKSFLRRNIE